MAIIAGGHAFTISFCYSRVRSPMEVDIRMDLKPGELRCPRCFHRDIVPSYSRGVRDAVMRWVGRVPRHCRACGRRFFVKAARNESKVKS